MSLKVPRFPPHYSLPRKGLGHDDAGPPTSTRDAFNALFLTVSPSPQHHHALTTSTFVSPPLLSQPHSKRHHSLPGPAPIRHDTIRPPRTKANLLGNQQTPRAQPPPSQRRVTRPTPTTPPTTYNSLRLPTRPPNPMRDRSQDRKAPPPSQTLHATTQPAGFPHTTQHLKGPPAP